MRQGRLLGYFVVLCFLISFLYYASLGLAEQQGPNPNLPEVEKEIQPSPGGEKEEEEELEEEEVIEEEYPEEEEGEIETPRGEAPQEKKGEDRPKETSAKVTKWIGGPF